MKALVFRGPHDIAVEDRPDPVPGRGEVLIRILATGICGSDVHGYSGENGRRHPAQVMGHETVGLVQQVGAEAGESIELGALVTINPVISCGSCADCASRNEQRCSDRRVIGVDPSISAAFAELMVVPASNVVLLPAGMEPELGSLVEPLAVGYHAARRGGVDSSSTVLVIGGGPIGQAAALAVERLGGAVAVAEIDHRRRQLLQALGFAAMDPAHRLLEAIEECLGDAPDVVIDAVGIPATLEQACSVSQVGATIVLVGMGKPQLDISAYRISTEERTIVGSFCYGSHEFSETAQWTAANAARLKPLIDAVVDMTDAPAAFQGLADGTTHASKILVRPTASLSSLVH